MIHWAGFSYSPSSVHIYAMPANFKVSLSAVVSLLLHYIQYQLFMPSSSDFWLFGRCCHHSSFRRQGHAASIKSEFPLNVTFNLWFNWISLLLLHRVENNNVKSQTWKRSKGAASFHLISLSLKLRQIQGVNGALVFLEYGLFLQASDSIRGICRWAISWGSLDHSVLNFSSLSTVQFAKTN